MTMRIIDFAYTEGDERRKGIHPPHISDEDENQDEQEDKEDDQKKDYYHTINTLLSSTQIDLNTFIDISIFQEMHSTHLQNILLPTLANLLHSTPSLGNFYMIMIQFHMNIIQFYDIIR